MNYFGYYVSPDMTESEKLAQAYEYMMRINEKRGTDRGYAKQFVRNMEHYLFWRAANEFGKEYAIKHHFTG